MVTRRSSTAVLCYGDSNTWGLDPTDGSRFDEHTRWPGVLRAALGGGFHVVEEGLSGRTTVWDDPFEPHRNGLTYLEPCLASHRPIDVVVLMLGSNDLKTRFALSAADVANGVATVASVVLQSRAGRDDGPPRLLLIAPPPVRAPRTETDDFTGSGPKSAELSARYQTVADQLGAAFLDAGPIAPASDTDGLHLSADSHLRLGRAVASAVTDLVQ